MFEKIVVPLDGSKLAEVALPYAEELGAKMDSNIVLLSVLEWLTEGLCHFRRCGWGIPWHCFAKKGNTSGGPQTQLRQK